MADKVDKNTKATPEYKAMLKRFDELKKMSGSVYKKEREAFAYSQTMFQAKEKILETELEIYKQSIKDNKIITAKQAKKQAKKQAAHSVTQKKLGLTEGDKILGKHGLKNMGSMAMQGGLHALGAGTENPLFNLAANALGKRRNRITEARQNTFDHENKKNKDENDEDVESQSNKNEHYETAAGEGESADCVKICDDDKDDKIKEIVQSTVLALPAPENDNETLALPAPENVLDNETLGLPAPENDNEEQSDRQADLDSGMNLIEGDAQFNPIDGITKDQGVELIAKATTMLEYLKSLNENEEELAIFQAQIKEELDEANNAAEESAEDKKLSQENTQLENKEKKDPSILNLPGADKIGAKKPGKASLLDKLGDMGSSLTGLKSMFSLFGKGGPLLGMLTKIGPMLTSFSGLLGPAAAVAGVGTAAYMGATKLQKMLGILDENGNAKEGGLGDKLYEFMHGSSDKVQKTDEQARTDYISTLKASNKETKGSEGYKKIMSKGIQDLDAQIKIIQAEADDHTFGMTSEEKRSIKDLQKLKENLVERKNRKYDEEGHEIKTTNESSDESTTNKSTTNESTVNKSKGGKPKKRVSRLREKAQKKRAKINIQGDIVTKYAGESGKITIKMGEIFVDGKKNDEATKDYHEQLVKSGNEKEGWWEQQQDARYNPKKLTDEEKLDFDDSFDEWDDPANHIQSKKKETDDTTYTEQAKKQKGDVKSKPKITPNELQQKKIDVIPKSSKNKTKEQAQSREKVIEKTMKKSSESALIQKEVETQEKQQPIIISAPAPTPAPSGGSEGTSSKTNTNITTSDGSNFGNKLYGAY